MQSTSFQFGGAILTTDDPLFERRLLRIVDMLMLFLIQGNSLLMELRVLVGLQTTIAQRTIDIMDSAVEAVERVASWLNRVTSWFNGLFSPLYWTPIRGLG